MSKRPIIEEVDDSTTYVSDPKNPLSPPSITPQQGLYNEASRGAYDVMTSSAAQKAAYGLGAVLGTAAAIGMGYYLYDKVAPQFVKNGVHWAWDATKQGWRKIASRFGGRSTGGATATTKTTSGGSYTVVNYAGGGPRKRIKY